MCVLPRHLRMQNRIPVVEASVGLGCKVLFSSRSFFVCFGHGFIPAHSPRRAHIALPLVFEKLNTLWLFWIISEKLRVRVKGFIPDSNDNFNLSSGAGRSFEINNISDSLAANRGGEGGGMFVKTGSASPCWTTSDNDVHEKHGMWSQLAMPVSFLFLFFSEGI